MEELAASFDLSHVIGERPLGEWLAETVLRLSDTSSPDWGRLGPSSRISREDRGFLQFYYAPHLYPGMEEKLRLAHKLQFELLPRQLPERAPVRVAAVLESYCHLSGDLFGWRREGAGDLLLWILDISGHGVGAGLASAVLSLIIELADPDLQTDELVGHLNHSLRLCQKPQHRPFFATGFFARISMDGRLCYTSAAHPPALLRRVDGSVEQLEATNKPVGLFGLFPHERYRTRELRLDVGDMLLLYTDGVSEATDSRDVEFGYQRLEAILRQEHATPEELTGAVYWAIADHQALEALDDDVTYLAAQRVAP